MLAMQWLKQRNKIDKTFIAKHKCQMHDDNKEKLLREYNK